MINLDTVYFISMLNELAELSLSGFKPFSEATRENINDCIFYTDDIVDEDLHPIVRNHLINEHHHDVIDVYGCETEQYVIGVVLGGDKPYIEARFNDAEEYYMISEGRWWCA